MEHVAGIRVQARSRLALDRIDPAAIRTWALVCALILYLAFNGGGYSLASHAQVGLVVWWIVVISAAWGLLPVTRPSRAGLVTIGFFGAFTAWTAVAITWSISRGRSLDDLTLVTCFLGILVLASAIHRDREGALRHTVAAVATAITIVAAVAIASRLWPGLFPGSQQTSQYFGALRSRLAWPLNYWNALAALMVVGLPLLLSLATSARTLRAQALAAAAVPLLALCGALTLSRGAVIAAAVAVVVFFALCPDRIPKLATAAVTAAGSAILVAAAFHRHAIQQALSGGAEPHQAVTMVVVIVLTCAGVALAQVGVGLLARHGTLPRLLTVSVGRARVLLAIGVVLVIAVALAAGAPGRLHRAWDGFKNPHSSITQATPAHFGATSGEGRYQYWQAAIDSAKPHIFTGSGPGTFQLDWLPRAPFESYVTNAHSLYIETYAELGLIGVAVLIGFFLAALVFIGRLLIRSRYEQRIRIAAVAAALLAFMVSAAFDWIWQMPVIPAAILLLIAAVLAPERAADHERAPADAPAPRRRGGLVTQLVCVVVGLGCLVGIAYPLATSTAITRSQQAANDGNVAVALADARDAVNLEPSSSAGWIQLALVLETQKSYGQAVVAARHAVGEESQNWANWLTLSRLYVEQGNVRSAVVAYRRARALNPQSSLFHQS